MAALTSSLQRNWIIWAALLFIAAVTALSLASGQKMLGLIHRAENSQNVLLELEALESDLKDVETGARGYVITGEDPYLEPFRNGGGRIHERIARLQQLTQDDQAMKPALQRLEALAQAKLNASTRLVELRKQQGSLRSEELARGRVLMDRIRLEAARLTSTEQESYAASRRAVQEQEQMATLGLLLGVLLSLGILGLSFAVRNKEAARRAAAEADLRKLTAQLEERVEDATAELRRSQELLSAVVEGIPDVVFVKDGAVAADLPYVMINKAGEEQIRQPRHRMIGLTDRDIFPQAHADETLAEDRHVLASRVPMHVAERTIETPDGRRIVETRKFAITNHDEAEPLLLGIARDITEQRTAENSLRQMQRIDAVGQLTGGMAHDFNNLLAVIIGNIELLQEHLSDGDPAAELGGQALEAATRGADLVRRLLAFARQQRLEPQVVDLNERLPNIVALLRRVLRDDIRIEVISGENLWKALIDPSQVDDALMNLAINARDAMASGGALTIETANVVLDEEYASQNADVAPGAYVLLAVSDTGSGMSPGTMARAFEPFFTTKDVGRGTGLGLSQIYGWIKQSGGHVKIYSEPEHGTTVRLYLPRAGASPAEDDGEPVGATELTRGGETILVVEDNPNVRTMVVRRLNSLGYRTIDAEDGRTALELVNSGVLFDLLFTDMVMPGGMTGEQLAAQVKEIKPGTRVLYTSGYTELAVQSRSNGPEILRTLSKPYRKEDLARAVRIALEMPGGEVGR